MYGATVTEWFDCAQRPPQAGWYEVRRFTEDGAPFKIHCTRLYWNGEGWYYDPDCCVPAIMNPESCDGWRALTYTLM